MRHLFGKILPLFTARLRFSRAIQGSNMNKRRFLAMGAVGAGALVQTHAATPNARKGTGLLTVSGATARSNCGALDPALDQLLVKHKAAFDRAWEFDAAMLARLPAQTIQPTLEYDAKVHKLAGPALSAVVEAAGGRACLPDDRGHHARRCADGPGRAGPAVGLVRRRPVGCVQGQTAQGALRPVSLGPVCH